MTRSATQKLVVGSKWTRLNPENKEKHFELVTASHRLGWVELRAVYSGKIRRIDIESLLNLLNWGQGWR